jgi:hypothetical protein
MLKVNLRLLLEATLGRSFERSRMRYFRSLSLKPGWTKRPPKIKEVSPNVRSIGSKERRETIPARFNASSLPASTAVALHLAFPLRLASNQTTSRTLPQLSRRGKSSFPSLSLGNRFRERLLPLASLYPLPNSPSLVWYSPARSLYSAQQQHSPCRPSHPARSKPLFGAAVRRPQSPAPSPALFCWLNLSHFVARVAVCCSHLDAPPEARSLSDP